MRAAYHSGVLGHVRCTTADSDGEDDMVNVYDTDLVLSLDSDCPFAVSLLLRIQDLRVCPDVQLHGLGV